MTPHTRPGWLLGIGLGLSTAIAAQSAQILADIESTVAQRGESLRPFYNQYLECGSYLIGRGSKSTTTNELWRLHPHSGAIDLAFRMPGGAVSGAGCVDFGAGPRLWVRGPNQLWLSDTTPNGSYLAVSSPMVRVDTVGNSVFLVDQEATARMLRRFDGKQLHTLQRFPSHVRIGSYTTTSSGVTYFIVGDGNQLWRTDGTAVGTRQVAQGAGWWITAIRALGNRLLMTAVGTNGSELWISDGTANGTRELIDIRPGAAGSEPAIWAGLEVGNQLVFSADDGSRGRELWTTDGTANGTRLLVDIGPGSSDPYEFAIAAQGLVFRASDPNNRSIGLVYSFDGRVARALGPTIRGSRSIEPIGNGRVAFTTSSDDELFVTDGSVAGTVRLDLIPGTKNSAPKYLTPVAGGGVVFEAARQQGDRVLWRSDGTLAATRVIGDFSPGTTTEDSNPHLGPVDPGVGGDSFYFGATTAAQGAGIYRLHNRRVVRLANGTLHRGGSTEIVHNGRVLRLFSSSDATGKTIWASDGTPAGTRAIASSIGTYWASLGDRAVFVAADLNGTEPWVSDGTRAGTHILRDIVPGLRSSVPRDLIRLDDRIVFVASDDQGTTVWATDGTAAGTQKLAPNLPQHLGGPTGLTQFDGHIYFFNGGDLWRTDGTASGTVRAIDLPQAQSPLVTFVIHDLLYFVMRGGDQTEIWRTNGAFTARVVRNLTIQSVVRAVVSGGRAFLVCNRTSLGVFDPSASRFELIAPDLQGPLGLLPASGGVYFSATSADHGRELFYTDGSTRGTHLVCDLQPGRADSLITELAMIGDDLVFVGTSAAHGRELFRLRAPAKAHVVPAGLGCGPLAQRTLSASDPALGSIAAIRGSWPATVRSGVVLFGLPTRRPVGLPMAPGCAVQMETTTPIVVLGATTTSQWTLPLPIPNAGGLDGHSVVVQSFAIQPKLIASNALRLVIGQR